MLKLVVALTPDALNKAISDHYKYNIAIGRLMQHKVLFSDIIKDEYEKFFRDNDNLMFYQQWVKTWTQYDYVEYCESLEDDFNSEVVAQMKQFPLHIVVCDKWFNGDRETVKKLRLDDINDRNNHNEFNIYCLPVSRQIAKGTPIKEIYEWLSNLLQDEETITIIDGFILQNTDNCNLLKKYYFPMMSSAKKISVYYDGDYTVRGSEISQMKKQYKNRVLFLSSDHNDIHDRYICCRTFGISIGVGLDFVDLSTGKTRKPTKIDVSTENKPPLPAPYKRW